MWARCPVMWWAVVAIALAASPDVIGADETPTGVVDYADELPRIPQTAPADAPATMVVRPGFAVDLAVTEPLLASPVAIAWDEDGRLFVAEMRGYSEDQGERLGRIRLLHDDDADGTYDRATIYADGLAWPTALVVWSGGLFVGDAPNIVWLKDTDGDGVADEQKTIFTGFGTSNVQGLFNSFAFDVDGRIHGAGSSTGGEIRRVGENGVRLSGGQRQRIGIARALYKRADVLVLDEATSALDNETESEVIDTIEALGREITVNMVAHRLTTLGRCDRIVRLAGGRVESIQERVAQPAPLHATA